MSRGDPLLAKQQPELSVCLRLLKTALIKKKKKDYSRQQNLQAMGKQPSNLYQESELNMGTLEFTGTPNLSLVVPLVPLSSEENEYKDPDISSAIRKPICSCIMLLIAKYVSCHRLSLSYRAFTTNVSSVEILKFAWDALIIPGWREGGHRQIDVFFIQSKGNQLIMFFFTASNQDSYDSCCSLYFGVFWVFPSSIRECLLS